MYLARPAARYKDSFIIAIKEFQMEGRNLRYDLQQLESNFEGAVKNILAKEPGEIVYWLIDDGSFVGRVSIRPVINDYMLNHNGQIGYEIRPTKRQRGYGSKILKLALVQAKKMQLDKLLITCEADNTASIRIIEKNGGVFLDKTFDESISGFILRYWIQILTK